MYRKRYSKRKTSRRSRGSRHQTAIQFALSSTNYTQSDAIIVPALTTGQFSRYCSTIRFQVAVDHKTTDAQLIQNIGWAVQYVPAGSNAQTLNFHQATAGDLCLSNQFILATGIFQSD